jgi:hypothetical protein
MSGSAIGFHDAGTSGCSLAAGVSMPGGYVAPAPCLTLTAKGRVCSEG